jgi:hypothetical protein
MEPVSYWLSSRAAQTGIATLGGALTSQALKRYRDKHGGFGG